MSEFIATMHLSNSHGLGIVKIEYDIDDKIHVKYSNEDKLYKRKIHNTLSGRPFFRLHNSVYYIDEFLRTNI